jgi:choline-glycine betaine transporter
MKLKTRISMHSALTTETPEFFFICYASIIGLSLYCCTVPYGTVRYGTVQGHKYVTWSVFNR